jgi:hypothetical protein
MNDIKIEYYTKRGYPISLLNKLILGIHDIPNSWDNVIIKLDADLTKLYPSYHIHQIKSRFGELRYYVSGVASDHPLILEAERTCSELNNL